MINNKVMVFWLLFALIIIVFGSLVVNRVFFHHYILDVTLANNIVVTSEWKEIGSPELLRIEKDNHYVSLLLEPPFKEDTPAGGIRTPGGTIINPEIRVFDDQGKEYALRFGGGRGFQDKNFVNYRFEPGLPADKNYIKVMIRSSHPLPIKQILWSGYDTKDLP